MSIYRIAHLSDPHLPPPPGAFGWKDVFTKRLLSRIAWRKKRKVHRPEVLSALVADLKASAPDHVVISGDLTNFASHTEIAAARKWLESLGEPTDFTVSPGNHDALAGAGGPERFAIWAPWLGDDGESRFPQVRLRGPVAIFNLCSAVPTAPHLATGRLGEEQLRKLDAALADPAYDGFFKLVVLHHPPHEGAVSKRKSLDDGHALREVLERRGADLVLHGHAHEALLGALRGPDGATVPVLGVPSASARPNRHGPARWNAIEIEPRAAGGFDVRIVSRGIEAGREGLTELGRFSLSSADSGP
ncbi:metallophosphoesterase [Caulobacter segnis]|uniref:Metallophosphoesterase n=2 Tax=Caulobacter segnis TaxID=88688 RepID=D5VKZ6_CAUST|nr:metallophosphoesterase [Caulobacter segnis]ADG11169.1 metallophosphoesterase [Caulobacter segnis ATCC 21756]AVQ02854.1 metallophosphoesterase [Caulobacter segnis]